MSYFKDLTTTPNTISIGPSKCFSKCVLALCRNEILNNITAAFSLRRAGSTAHGKIQTSSESDFIFLHRDLDLTEKPVGDVPNMR